MSEPYVIAPIDGNDLVIVGEVDNPFVVVTAEQGPPGVHGDNWLPDPATMPDGQIFISDGGQYIAAPLPDGSGDMHSLIYDPQGVASNVFDAGNLFGNLDGGVFT